MSSPLEGLWTFIAGGMVLLLPGAAWLAWLPEERANLVEALADTFGISLALTGLVALAAFLLAWRFTSIGLIGLYLLAALLAALGFARQIVRRTAKRLPDEIDPGVAQTAQPQEASNTLEATFTSQPNAWQRLWEDPLASSGIVLAGFACLLVWRFIQVRQLVLPAWVDSLHHVLIVRLILETGGIPRSLEPYLPVPFYYHFAFHASAAAFTFWSRLAVPQAVLWFGQVLNAIVALSVYRLGMVLWNDWRRSALAGLIVGFISQMPAYYATWGRYTLLAGLALLPLGMAAAQEIALRGISRGRLARLGILTGGILLAHYFAAVLLALFLIILGLQTLLHDLADRRILVGGRLGNWKDSRALALAAAGLGGALLVSPWIYRVWAYAGSDLSVAPLLSDAAVDAAYFPNYLGYLWRMLGPTRSYLILCLAPLGLLLAARRPETRPFTLWAVILGLFGLPWGLEVAPFRPDHVAIVLFIPVALLVADFFLFARERLRNGAFSRFGQAALAAAITGLLIWGLVETRDIVNPGTVIASPADLQALQWISVHTPPDALFLINVVYWQSGTYRGVDGGWWIPFLTGRQVLLPDVLYEWGSADYRNRVNTLAEKASTMKGCTSEFWDLVHSVGIQYIFLGSNPGSLRLADLESCAGLQVVYASQGATILQVAH
jgi:hypothetical protein